ncbi:hypothetical protein JZ751_011664 [Albula glossodonta]|uniref:Uncharacterized protein n=1 Tax=Albula glossodonta TaxID=121402 RepID=A0A8T2PQB7_9TELE|nr:hypothetical protein JZ751_011664 [Albula glossodonta]
MSVPAAVSKTFLRSPRDPTHAQTHGRRASGKTPCCLAVQNERLTNNQSPPCTPMPAPPTKSSASPIQPPPPPHPAPHPVLSLPYETVTTTPSPVVTVVGEKQKCQKPRATV